jgi:hypothetical protein
VPLDPMLIMVRALPDTWKPTRVTGWIAMAVLRGELKLPLNRPSAEAMASVKGGINRRGSRACP